MEINEIAASDLMATLLPEREALGVFNFAAVAAHNGSLALNAGTFGPAVATANATQSVVVTQV
ncbi:MAG: hypothetical protein ACKVWR_07860 [Acidimicrobiales bacterium]